MAVQTIDGSLIVRQSKRAGESGLAYYGKWRDSTRAQVNRKLGPAWIERHGDGWRKRRGNVPEGYLVPHEATERLRTAIAEHELQVADAAADGRAGVKDRRTVTFRDVAVAWHAHGATVGGWKPATIRDRRSVLRVHLLPAFGEQPIREIDRDDVRRWWRGLHDPRRTGGRLSDRNANKLLAELRAIFN